MKLLLKEAKYRVKKSDTAVIFLSEEFEKELDKQLPAQLAFVRDRLDLSCFKGKPSESLFLPFRDAPSLIFIGTGKNNDITSEHLRNFTQKIASTCRTRKISEVHIFLPSYKNINEEGALSAIAEGLYLSNYGFTKYKTKDDEGHFLPGRAFFLSNVKGSQGTLREIEIVCGNTLLCRDLVNETSDRANPLSIAREAAKLKKISGVTCAVYGKDKIEKMKMGLLLAVSRGSRIPPQLVVLRYRGNPNSRKNIVLVGKGITFDSGGMNLKPSAGIETMRHDMAGAAASLYAVKAAAELRLKKNITAVIPLCENMISRDSYRPGDVFTSYSGKSVEIGNTDAEGRLILADAIAFAEKTIKPDYIIDIATLTGACIVCFSELVAGVLSTDDALAEAIFSAGEATGERVWRLPLYREYEEDLKSDIADIKNVSATRNAGTIIGGIFLKNFVKDTPWAHIDIASTAWFTKQRGCRPKYATGFGVRLFVELIRRLGN